MGVVWLCERRLGDEVVQCVVLKRPRVDDPTRADEARRRFADEVRCLARISHGNIVRLLDAGSDTHGPWAAIEHVDGLDAHALIEALRARNEYLDTLEAAWIVREVTRGMSAAHGVCDPSGVSAPILHRDLSPQNVLLSRRGEVKVTDFGIAWAPDRDTRTTTGVVVGNLRYIAPEQLEGRPVSVATDVYGAGRLLEALLDVTASGAPCFAALRAVATCATQRDPDARPATMHALEAMLLDAAPELARASLRLGAHVTQLTHARDHVHAALAGLLSSERRSSPPSLPPEVPIEVPAALPSPAPVLSLEHAPTRWRTPLGVGVVSAALLITWGALRARTTTTPSSHRPVAIPIAHDAGSSPAVPPPEPPDSREDTAPPTVVDASSPPRDRGTLRVIERRVPRVAAHDTPDATITRAIETGTLRVNSMPFSRVSVDDGALIGVPHAFVVSAGEHVVRARFSRDGGDVEARRTVTVMAGETVSVGITPPAP
jgi:serine/threonine protein kinase